MGEKTKGRIILSCIYLIAVSVGLWATNFTGHGILMKSFVAVSATVLIIFTGSFIFNNSSVFDPYWSIAPPLIALFYCSGILLSKTMMKDFGYGFLEFLTGSPRILILFLFTIAYSVRLTWNFLRNWPGMKHEDWRYVDFRTNTRKVFWIVSLFGIHLFPAFMVFGGTLSIWVTIVHGFRPMNVVDLLAFLTTGYAILIEATADRQLRNFLSRNKNTGKTMNQGLWSVSRHPNYLGEILFWWGLYLFALAANPSFWWVIAGPIAINIMFIFVSIPMIEKRMLKRRKDYAAYQVKVSKLIPWKMLAKK